MYKLVIIIFLKGIKGSLKKTTFYRKISLVLQHNIYTVPITQYVLVHLDLQCPDCLMAWDALKQMANHYERTVKLSIVDFPLPYHRAAFKGKCLQGIDYRLGNPDCQGLI